LSTLSLSIRVPAKTVDNTALPAERHGLLPDGLTGSRIKWIAIAAMLIDHTAWAFVPFASAAGQAMHVVGRVTAPIMCFFIAEGYYYTKNVKKYAARLGVFALVSQMPYSLFNSGKIFSLSELNVIYTLFLSLLAVWAYDKIENRWLKTYVIIALCILSLRGDWMFLDILYSLIFWEYRGNFKEQARWFSVASAGLVVFSAAAMALHGRHFYSQLFQAGVFLCLPILALYNGKRGGGEKSKWAFYIFYPLHLLFLGIIKVFA